MEAQLTPEKLSRTGKIRWKGWQLLQQTQQSNPRRQERQRSKKKETEPHNMTNLATETWLPYADKEWKLYGTGGKFAPICQETQAEEAAV